MRIRRAMAERDWRLSHAFTVEAAKRQIFACDDLERLKHLTFHLLLQCEALKELTGTLLLKD